MPIQSDLLVQDLGLSSEDHELIVNNVEVIINSAASVNFDDPLMEALNINYFGTQRMLKLAKQCKRLKVFTHVSTAYVNCDMKGGLIHEKIYEQDNIDFEQVVSKIMAMS